MEFYWQMTREMSVPLWGKKLDRGHSGSESALKVALHTNSAPHCPLISEPVSSHLGHMVFFHFCSGLLGASSVSLERYCKWCSHSKARCESEQKVELGKLNLSHGTVSCFLFADIFFTFNNWTWMLVEKPSLIECIKIWKLNLSHGTVSCWTFYWHSGGPGF